MTEQAESRREPITGRPPIRVSLLVYARLNTLKDQQQRRLGRQVSFTEVIEQLLDRAGAA